MAPHPVVLQNHSSSIVDSLISRGTVEKTENEGESSKNGRIDRKAVWGLYCMYAMIGLFNGFWFAYLNTPICQYMFGPVNTPGHTNAAQCQVSTSMYQMPWNFKVFFAFFLDKYSFFGSRRRGWIIFGWTTAFIVLMIVALRAPSLLEENSTGDGGKAFTEYTMYIMLITFCFIFSDVAGDGMTIELSKLESEENRGYILSTGQMVRFFFLTGTSLIGMLAMSGPTWQNPVDSSMLSEDDWACPKSGGVELSMELSFGQVHWLLIGIGAPIFVAMLVLLKDPPSPEPTANSVQESHGIKGLWKTMSSYAVFMLILQNITNISVAQLTNPATNAIAEITSPDPFQTSIGNIIAYTGLVGGIWIFRSFLMNKNWRYTQIGTGVLIGLSGLLSLMMVQNSFGWGQTGWFYIVGSNGPQIVVGIQQVLSSLAVVEISPPGLEATVYELITTVHNYSITLCTVLSNLFIPVFALSDINTSTYCNMTDPIFNSPTNGHAAQKSNMLNATWMSIGVNVVGAVISTFFIPRSKEHCKEWTEKKTWHNSRAAVVNAALVLVPFTYAVVKAFQQMFS